MANGYTYTSNIPNEFMPANVTVAAMVSALDRVSDQYGEVGGHQSVAGRAGGGRVGGAILRLYRVRGGENGGVLGVGVGVAEVTDDDGVCKHCTNFTGPNMTNSSNSTADALARAAVMAADNARPWYEKSRDYAWREDSTSWACLDFNTATTHAACLTRTNENGTTHTRHASLLHGLTCALPRWRTSAAGDGSVGITALEGAWGWANTNCNSTDYNGMQFPPKVNSVTHQVPLYHYTTTTPDLTLPLHLFARYRGHGW
jgi:hypothetical protein